MCRRHRDTEGCAGYHRGRHGAVLRAAPATVQTVQHHDHHVVVLGASPKPTRYANQCIRLLQVHGYRVTPVHPRFETIEELAVTHRLADITEPVDTLTLYIGPQSLAPQADDIVRLRPARVIFNPGTESAVVQQRLDRANIEWFEACTLVLLRTGQF
jgi:predicted CoA-binding protein